MQNKRTQEERSAATRAALLDAARPLFAERGFADVGTPEIAAAAGVTRGALYHQFEDKVALFEAVVEAVEQEVTARLTELVVASGATDPLGAMRAAVSAWLDACAEPEVRRILLVEAPSALGLERWRAIAMRYGLGLVQGMLTAAMEAGQLARQPVRPLAHVLIGALDEAALYVAGEEDQATARTEVEAVLDGLLAALALSPGG